MKAVQSVPRIFRAANVLQDPTRLLSTVEVRYERMAIDGIVRAKGKWICIVNGAIWPDPVDPSKPRTWSTQASAANFASSARKRESS